MGCDVWSSAPSGYGGGGDRAHAAPVPGDRDRPDAADLSESSNAVALLDSDKSALMSGPWQVAYGDEPAQPVDLPHIWEDEPGRQHYSGAATYTTSIDLGAVDGRVSVDFGDCEVHDGSSIEHGLVGPSYRVAVRGPVGEVAQVRVNGVDCGLAWAPPYRVEISDALRSGVNEIEIIVYNTAANALAADQHIRRLAAESEAATGGGSRCRIWTRRRCPYGPVCYAYRPSW